MSRADPPIRQWTILKLLESNEKITLRRIASELEDPYHERTLRRDLEVLNLSGFPIYTERENGKTYWRLNDAYRRFPLPLTATELYALQCGKQFLAPLEGTFISESIQDLYKKINANLSSRSREYLSLLQQTVQIGIPPYKVYKHHRPLIERIKQAVEQSKTSEMHYAPLKGKAKKRRLNPYRLWYYKGALYLLGHCHLRKEVRIFAVDRIGSFRATEQRFQLPLYFSIEDYFKDAFGIYRGEAEPVSLLFEKPASQWVRERKWHASQRLTPLRGGKLRMDLQVAVTPEFLEWVVGFGAQVEALAPERLRRRVENEAWKVAGKYQKMKAPGRKDARTRKKEWNRRSERINPAE